MNTQEGKIWYGIGLDTSGLESDAKRARSAFKGIANEADKQSGRIDSAFKKVGAVVGMAAVGVMAKELYNFANAFDKSMREVSTISHTVSADMNGFKQSVLEMTTQIPVGANDAAKALYQIISAGHDGAKGMQVLEVSAKAAIGGVTETATAADAITTVLNAYKKDSAEAESISDQLFTTVRLGKTTFGELGQSISQAVPIAASFGIETEQVLAAVATLTKSGTPTAQAMTQIRAAIIGASKELGDGYFKTHTFQEGLAEIARRANGSEAELRRLIPEIEGMNGVLGLTGLNAKTAAEDLASLGTSAGATEGAFAKMKDGAEAQLTLLKNNTLKAFHEIGQGGLDVMSGLAKALNSAFETGAIDGLIAIMGALIATVGVYKAQLIVTNAVKLVGNNLIIAEEIKAYKALLPVKEMSKNKDIEMLVVKGQLSQKRAEELVAIRAEVQAELESLKVKAQAMAVEVAAAAQAHRNALHRSVVAKQNMKLAQSQMRIAIQGGNADEIASAKKATQTAKLEMNSAAIASNTTRQALGTAQTQSSAAATAVDTMQINLNTVSVRSATTAKTLWTAATKRLSSALKSLRLAFASNPMGLLLTGVTMAISLFSMFGDKVENAEESLSGVEKASKKAGEEFDKEAARIDALRYIIEKSASSYDRKKLAVSELQKIIPAYNAELDKEGKLIRSNTVAIDDYLKALEKQTKMRILEDERIESGKLQREAQRKYEAAKKENDKKLYNSAYGKNNDAIIDVASWFGLKDEQKTQTALDEATKNLDNANKAVSDLNNELVSIEGTFDGSAKVITFSDQLKNAATAVSELKTKLVDLRAGKGNKADFAKDIEETEKALKEAQSKYDLLSGIDSNSSNKDHSAQVQELMLKAEQAKIDVLQEGRAKELAQIELTRKEKLAALDKEQKEYAKKQGNKLTTQETAAFDDQRASVGLTTDKDIVAVNKKYDDEIADSWKALTDVFLTEEQKRTGSIKNEYAKRRENLDKLAIDGSVSKDEYIKMSLQIDASEAHSELKPMLDQYQTFADKRKEIESKFQSDIAMLNENGKTDQAAEASKQMDETLKKMDFEQAKKGIDLTKLFGNLDNVDLPSMNALRDKIKAWIDQAGNSLSPEDLKAVSDAFLKLEIKIADKNPFAVLKSSVVDYKEAVIEVEKAQEAYNKALLENGKDSEVAKKAAEALTVANNKKAASVAKANEAIGSVANKGKQIVGAAQDVIGIMGDLGVQVPEEVAGAIEGVGQVMDGLASIDLTSPMSIITGAVKVIGGLVTTITSLFGGSDKTLEELERRRSEAAEIYYFAELEVNQLYRDRYDWAKKIGESNLEHVKRQGEELKKQSSSNAKEQEELWKKLRGTEFKSGEHFEKTGLFGWGKGKIVEDWSSIGDKSWGEIEKLAASGVLSEEGQKYYEALKKAKEEGLDLAQSQLEYAEQVRELATGSSYQGVVDGIVNGFKNGKRSAADFAETFDDLMSGAVESALSLLADQKMRKWYEDFAVMGEDGYTEDEIAQAKEDYLKYIEQLNRDAEAIEQATGVKIGDKATNENSLGGQIRGSAATEASVDQLTGLYRSQTDSLVRIDGKLDIGFGHLLELARTNAAIEANTAATAANTAETVKALTHVLAGVEAIKKNTSSDLGNYGG